MYEVLKRFKDLSDGGHVYEAGDKYPRKGLNPSKERIEELSSDKNKRGEALIKEEPKAEKPKATKKKKK